MRRLWLPFLVLMAGCGGGGGTTNNPPPPPDFEGLYRATVRDGAQVNKGTASVRISDANSVRIDVDSTDPLTPDLILANLNGSTITGTATLPGGAVRTLSGTISVRNATQNRIEISYDDGSGDWRIDTNPFQWSGTKNVSIQRDSTPAQHVRGTGTMGANRGLNLLLNDLIGTPVGTLTGTFSEDGDFAGQVVIDGTPHQILAGYESGRSGTTLYLRGSNYPAWPGEDFRMTLAAH